MIKLGFVVRVFLAVFAITLQAAAQEEAPKIPVDTQLTLEAAPLIQQPVIHSVLYLKCKKTDMKGTAFVVSGGTVVTAAHVICGCDVADLEARTTLDRPVVFSKLIRDEDRDLAVLRPTQPLDGGLELAPDTNVGMAERVNTWGFPLIYNGPAPLLSVGYVSGYYEAPEQNFCDSTQTAKRIRVKHVVVNGAFNPGNSGGPLFIFGQNKVIGIVIWKSIAFTNQVQVAIDGFHHPAAFSGGTFSEKQADGTYKGISDQEVIARVLEEFYKKVQVDIGEAVSVSELRKFLKEHAKELETGRVR
jgi:S1-C subfamily serine protease